MAAIKEMFNCDMVFYYLKNRVTKSESRLSTVQEIAVTGEAYVTLKSSFPAEEIVEEDNFRSLLFYYGMLTISGAERGQLLMSIPNQCVREPLS